jgi:hypothetical protein
MMALSIRDSFLVIQRGMPSEQKAYWYAYNG